MNVLSMFGRVILYARTQKNATMITKKTTASKLRFVVNFKGRFSFRSRILKRASVLRPYEVVFLRCVCNVDI